MIARRILVMFAAAWMTQVVQSEAAIQPAPLFQDNMVLQRDQPLPVWGRTDAGQAVSVSIGRRHAETRADSNGYWKVTLKSLPANTQPQSMTIASGAATLTLTNVLVGEVWLCSGQSNMEFPVGQSTNSEAEVAEAAYSDIRMFTVARGPSAFPQRTCGGTWVVCSPQTVRPFSAVGYFFARQLRQELKVPVGMINASWGGTAIEPWTSIEALRELPFMKARLVAYEKAVADYTARREVYEQKQAAAQQAHEAAKAAWQKKIDESDPGAIQHWADPTTPLEGWQDITVPMPFDRNVLSNFIGYVWVRKDVVLPEAWVGKDLILHLGAIDDQDMTYFSGRLAGSSPVDMWNAPRQYTIPAALNTSAKASVVIRVSNQLGAIALTGGEKDYWLKPAGMAEAQPLALAGRWSCRYGTAVNLKTMPQPPRSGIPGTTPGEPATLFNSMIAPLVPYALRGAIWYQGESNAGRPAEYQVLLPALIASWRRAWDQGPFPFGIVQLANFMARQQKPIEAESWADLRDAQAATLSTRQTGLAVTIDIGAANDIHPRNKQEVGRRLALWALAEAYDRDAVFSGPMFRSLKVRGNQAMVRFNHTGSGLTAHGQPLAGFALAGTNKVFHAAQARIEGQQVIASSAAVPNPVAVRYAWANNPICNLYNVEGLPAAPFRTDRWARTDVKAADGEPLYEPQPVPQP